jgi:hypothetical protein
MGDMPKTPMLAKSNRTPTTLPSVPPVSVAIRKSAATNKRAAAIHQRRGVPRNIVLDPSQLVGRGLRFGESPYTEPWDSPPIAEHSISDRVVR